MTAVMTSSADEEISAEKKTVMEQLAKYFATYESVHNMSKLTRSIVNDPAKGEDSPERLERLKLWSAMWAEQSVMHDCTDDILKQTNNKGAEYAVKTHDEVMGIWRVFSGLAHKGSGHWLEGCQDVHLTIKGAEILPGTDNKECLVHVHYLFDIDDQTTHELRGTHLEMLVFTKSPSDRNASGIACTEMYIFWPDDKRKEALPEDIKELWEHFKLGELSEANQKSKARASAAGTGSS